MVHGLEHFKHHFKMYADDYVLIGGVASYVLLDEVGAPKIRPTKDLDIVIFIHSSSNFINTLKKYIRDGGYQVQTDDSNNATFYRFQNPKNKEYPAMLELFSAKDQNFILSDEQKILPIVEEGGIKSLSAILLDAEYYNLIKNSKQNKGGLSALNPDALIVFKAKAYLDIKSKGEDSKKWKKHRSDIINLAVSFFSDTDVCSLSESIKNDFNNFVNQLEKELTSDIIKGACKQNIEPIEILRLLKKVFLNVRGL